MMPVHGKVERDGHVTTITIDRPEVMKGDDSVEGSIAFEQKRKPQWKGL